MNPLIPGNFGPKNEIYSQCYEIWHSGQVKFVNYKYDRRYCTFVLCFFYWWFWCRFSSRLNNLRETWVRKSAEMKFLTFKILQFLQSAIKTRAAHHICTWKPSFSALFVMCWYFKGVFYVNVNRDLLVILISCFCTSISRSSQSHSFDKIDVLWKLRKICKKIYVLESLV